MESIQTANLYAVHLCFCFFCFFQTLMSVKVMTLITVMRMHSALTQWEVSRAPATLAMLEMAGNAQVEIDCCS